VTMNDVWPLAPEYSIELPNGSDIAGDRESTRKGWDLNVINACFRQGRAIFPRS